MRTKGKQSLRALQIGRPYDSLARHAGRSFASSPLRHDAQLESASDAPVAPPLPTQSQPSKAKREFSLPEVDPNLVQTRREERIAMRSGTPPIGSRRRRVALNSTANIPFEHLPYQCFQEARKILLEDRAEKIAQIATQRDRIEKARKSDAGSQGKSLAERRMKSMTKRLEQLKIFADVNDPLVKKRFEDGQGDMSRPIYRYYAERKWRAQRSLILMQRVTQMHVVPDVLPSLEMTVDMHLSFGRTTIHPGEKVPSALSENPPKLTIQPFDSGERLVTIAVVDPDVPNPETNGFDTRTHFLACNVPISPTDPVIRLGKYKLDDLEDTRQQLVKQWTPPYGNKGAPYHRLCIVVMQQKPGQVIDMAEAKTLDMQSWSMRKFMSARQLKPVGVFLFRTEWDRYTDSLMHKLGVQGSDIEFKRKRVEPLPYKKKPSDSERYR